MTIKKKILVDCSNTYSGGAKTHLKELAARISYASDEISYTFVGENTILDILPAENSGIRKRTHFLLNRGSLARYLWRAFWLPALVKGFDLVFYPGGTIVGRPKKSVTMSRNMLPVMRNEYARYGPSIYYLKSEILRALQRRSYRRASGIIFLSEFAMERVLEELGLSEAVEIRSTLIPHGVTDRYRHVRKEAGNPFPIGDEAISLLYVSSIDVYKNQDTVLLAGKSLRDAGRNVRIVFVGPRNPVAYRKLAKLRRRLDPDGEWSRIDEEVSQRGLLDYFSTADIFVYASTCENLPNILLEGMTSRVPIVCSDARPMSDVLGDGGIYFEPRDPNSLYVAIEKVIASGELRDKLARAAFERAMSYDWDVCARDTFAFLESLV